MKPEAVKDAKKKIAEKVIDKGLEYAAKPVKEAIAAVEKKLNSPVDETVDAFGQLTTLDQLVNVAKTYEKKAGYNALKKLENLGIAAISLIPILGTAGTDLTEAAILEGATAAEAKALATGAVVADGGEVAYPLTHLIGEKGVAKLGTVLKALNPFEDVHPAIVAACGAVGLVVPGFGAVPSGIEIAALTIKDIKNAAHAANDAKNIIAASPELASVKNFTKSVLTGIQGRIDMAASPRMNQAVAAFAA